MRYRLCSRQGGGLGAVRRRLRPVVPHALRRPQPRRAARRRRLRVRRLRARPPLSEARRSVRLNAQRGAEWCSARHPATLSPASDTLLPSRPRSTQTFNHEQPTRISSTAVYQCMVSLYSSVSPKLFEYETIIYC